MIDTSSIFQEFSDDEISEPSIETENVYGWIAPDLRDEKDQLTTFGLRPYRPRFQPGTPVPQLQPGEITSRYFFKVYDRTDEEGIQLFDEASYPQFTVTYGHTDGLGSPPNSNQPTEAIYQQYANSVLPKNEDSFGFERDHFYAVNLNRRAVQDSIREGYWELTLAFEGQGPQNGVTLVDETVSNPSAADKQQIEVVPGDLNSVASSPLSDKTYGYVYPAKGIIVLNPDALSDHAYELEQQQGTSGMLEAITPEIRDPNAVIGTSGTYEVVQNTNSDGEEIYEFTGGFVDVQAAEQTYPAWPFVRNHRKIYESINRGESFRLQAKKKVIDATYTVVLDQEEGNFSFNPTYYDSQGNITFPEAPGTYPTAIGLYNDDYELLAVGKLSSPEFKDDDNGLVVDITLDF